MRQKKFGINSCEGKRYMYVLANSTAKGDLFAYTLAIN